MTKRHIDGDAGVQRSFARIRDIAAAMRTALERRDWSEVGRQIAAEWDNRKQLAPGVTTPEIDAMLAAARDGRLASAARSAAPAAAAACSASASPTTSRPIRQALADAGARVLDFTIEARGLVIDTF